MGSSAKTLTRRLSRPLDEASKKTGQALEKPFRTGASSTQRKLTKQSLLQRQKEKIRAAEAEDEIARRRGLASSGKGGRQSLIRSSSTGLSKTLGG